MRNHWIIGLALAAAATGPALAQSATTTPAAMNGMAMGGMQMADHASAQVKFVAVSPAEIMSSKLVGLTVYNNQNEKLGEVEDLAIDNGQTIKGVVVSVGGFLGLGERYVLIDPATVTISNKDNSMKAVVDTNKDTLKNAPEFKYTKKNG